MSSIEALSKPGTVLLRTSRDGHEPVWLKFSQPLAVLSASRAEEVVSLLYKVDEGVRSGHHAAGYISYEAAPAFDPAFVTHPAGPLPLAWFGLYDEPDTTEEPPHRKPAASSKEQWTLGQTPDEYHQAIGRIKEYIAAGDTYQVNYTFRLSAELQEDSLALFMRMWRASHAPYAAYLHTGADILCSASPELFFELSGQHIRSCPMKGTAPRGRWLQEDQEIGEALRNSEKNRAENVMIVDMVRNDLGRIAKSGSVRVSNLFSIKRYPTLWQMTSTVEAETDAPFSEIVAALFPCASITGAPKVRTMQIIAELENGPRGIYTGCIGYISPKREAQFNVAIRTAHIPTNGRKAEYGTGGGIVWDSVDSAEYEECRTKALVLNTESPDFQLLETILWQPDSGYLLLDRHIERLQSSANYFDFSLRLEDVVQVLSASVSEFQDISTRVRLLVARNGEIEINTSPADTVPALNLEDAHIWSAVLAIHPIDTGNVFLFHKTTHRDVYEQFRREHPSVDEIILWNERGELTETTVASLILELEGELVTPPIECGLLNGTFRADLLDRSIITERVIRKKDLLKASALFAVNSVRGWICLSLAHK